MKIRLDKIVISQFKRIESLTIELGPMTALVGGNTSGKSSALQAAQLGVSILQAAFRGSGTLKFSGTVSNDAVLFRPTEQLLDLRRGDRATQNSGYSITYSGVDLDAKTNKKMTIEIRRGKNANIAITRTGDNDLAAVLASGDIPFSIFTPGLSGIPIREEWRTKGAMDAAVMHGDANLYLRTVLDHLFTRDLDEEARETWCEKRDIDLLPDSGWKKFSTLLDRCYQGVRLVVDHNPQRDRYIRVDVEMPDTRVTLDMASTGVLQVIQIIAYACFYAPPLLLLDEPDAHLHADSQSRLYEALRWVATETQTRILFASHSPQLIQRLMYDPDALVIWMSEGAKVPVDDAQRPAIPILMALGALSAGADVFDPARRVILMTEDELPLPITVLAKANGAPDNLAVLSYNGCGSLLAARQLANMIIDIRSDDARIILHRDRDFRTDAEIQFELATAAAEHQRNGVTHVTEVFTPFNDVEHSFVQAEHLKQVFPEINPNTIDDAIRDVTKFKRDDLVQAAHVAREQVCSSLYIARKRKKPEWKTSGMPDKSPPIGDFVPANGHIAVSFKHTHGKMLMKGLLPKIHNELGGKSQVSNDRFYTATNHLQSRSWEAAFNLPVPD